MKTIILLLLSVAALSAQGLTLTVSTTVPADKVPVLRWWVMQNFAEEADTDENGVLSRPEAVAWYSMRFKRDVINADIPRAFAAQKAADLAQTTAEYQAIVAQIATLQEQLKALERVE